MQLPKISATTGPQHYILLYLSLALVSIAVAYFIIEIGMIVGVLTLILTIGLPLALLALLDIKSGLLLLLFYSYSFPTISRLIPVALPLGLIIEVTLILLLLGLLLNFEISWRKFNNPVTYILGVIVIYSLLQALNPNMVGFTAWINYTRSIFFTVVTYFVLMHIFDDLEYVIKFTKVWLALAVLVALYAYKQEYLGFEQFEWNWIHAAPGRYNLMFIWGHWRKFSLLSDVSAFGLFMGYSGVVPMILALFPFRTKYRIMAFIAGLVILIAMNYSGTRTSTVLALCGFFLYLLMTLNRRSSIIFAVCAVTILVAIYYGPFHNPQIGRFRSTFRISQDASQDASMGVRDRKRIKFQPYIRSHPIGGGVNTAGNRGLRYSPGHPLAGQFAPDSGYLRIAMEMGPIGLILYLTLHFLILREGVLGYFKTRNLKIKGLYAAYTCSYFGVSIANFAQESFSPKPLSLITFSAIVILIRLKDFDSSASEPQVEALPKN